MNHQLLHLLSHVAHHVVKHLSKSTEEKPASSEKRCVQCNTASSGATCPRCGGRVARQ